MKPKGYSLKYKYPDLEPKVILNKDMKPGEIGFLKDTAYGTSPYYDQLVLKVYGALVLLSDPMVTRNQEQENIKIELAPPGTEITITSGERV